VDECGIAVFFEFALHASNLADASLEQSRRFGLCPFAVENHLHHLEHVPFTLPHLDTIPELYLDHLAPLLGLSEEDTSIELTPDISNGVQHSAGSPLSVRSSVG